MFPTFRSFTMFCIILKTVHSINTPVTSEFGAIRFCAGNASRRYDLTSSKCPEGIFFNSFTNHSRINRDVLLETKWKCICTQGAWYIQSGICDSPGNQLLFTYGNVTCFTVNSILTTPNHGGISYIGASSSADADTVPVLLTSLDNGLLMRPQPSEADSSYVVSLGNPEHDPCFRCDYRHPGPGLTVIRIDPVGSWSVTRSNGLFSLCLTATGKNLTGIFGYKISELCRRNSGLNEGGEIYLKFAKGCEYEDGNEWNDIEPFNFATSIIPSSDNGLVVPEAADSSCQSCAGDDFGVHSVGFSDDCLPEDLLDRTELEYSMDKQSSRIGMYLQNVLLKPEEAEIIKEDWLEIQLLTKASVIAYGACNMNVIPKVFFQYFMIMLKALVSETFENYPPHTTLKGENLEWVVGALDKCKSRTIPYNFIVEGECETQYRIVRINRTNLPIILPERFKANPEKHDYLLEFTWKLSTFLFYHCYAEFEDGATYHYELREQIESIMNEGLLLRWRNPSNSLKMYKHIFRAHFDLPEMMENFENCVGAAHLNSKYAPDIWMKKPIDRPNGVNWNRQKRDTDTQIQNMDTGFRYFEMSTVKDSFQCVQKLDNFLQTNNISTRKCWK